MADTSTDIVLEDNNAFLIAMGEGSRLEIHGADAAKESWTHLETTAEAGSDQLIVQDTTGWEVGDVIAVASTDSWDQSEEFTILEISDDGTTMTLNGELQNTHQGETRNYDNGLTGDDYMEWDADIRAEVALLSRSLTIQGDEDSEYDGYGGHTMVMDGAEQYISGAEFKNMGQRGELGRYPIHFHLLGDAEGQYVKNNSIHNTYNKGTTIHGTSYILYQENALYEQEGHGLFLEEGSENLNQIVGNLIFGTKASDEETAVIITDATDVSSYWLESASQIMVDNSAGGSEINGISLFPSNEVHGASLEAGIDEAGDIADLIFKDNTVHSNTHFGMSLEGTIDADTLEVVRGGIDDAKFAEIDGLLAFANALQGFWAFTNDLVLDNSMIVGNPRTGVFSKGGNYINNTVIADNGSAGGQLYANGGTELRNVHFEGNEGSDLFIHGTANTTNGPHTLFSITSGDDEVLDINFYNDDAALSLRTVLDVDGSGAGTAGAALTGGDTNNEFAAAPDAYYDEDLEVWVSEATIGWTRVISANLGTLDVTRSDGSTYEDYPYYGNDYVLKTASGMAHDIAYLLDFETVPSQIRLANQYMQGGESVVYEIPNIDSHGTIRNASAVLSFDELLTATNSSYYYADSSLYIRIVAEESTPEDLPVDEYLADYLDTENILIKDIVMSTDSVDDPSFTPELLTAIEDQPARDVDLAPEVAEATLTSANDDFELELYESTSETTVVTDDMQRWSDATSWDGGIVPGAGSVAVLNEDDTMVLDTSTTVQGVIVNGGKLMIEDDVNLTIDFFTDFVLVMNGGLFQAGTEDDPLDTVFTMTLDGDNPDFDLEVTEHLEGNMENTIFAAEQTDDPEDDSSYLASELSTDGDTPTLAYALNAGGDDFMAANGMENTIFAAEQTDDPEDDSSYLASELSTDGDTPTLAYALNAGGDDFMAANGVEYQADDFDNGETFSTTEDISGTEDDGLYQSERWNSGGFTYENEVENGTYDVALNFADTWAGTRTSGSRVFDVYIEDVLVYDDLDVTGEAGFRTPVDLIGEVEVADGSLTITTTSEVENPEISGFSIWEAEGELTPEFVVGSLYDDYSLYA